MKQFLMVFLIGMMIPYITTLAWTGLEGNVVDEAEEVSSGEDVIYTSDLDREKKVIVIRNGRETEISVEEFLPHVLAAQIPSDFEVETLKASLAPKTEASNKMLDTINAANDEITALTNELTAMEPKQLLAVGEVPADVAAMEGYIADMKAKIAEVRGITAQEVLQTACENACRLFNISLPL